MTKEKLVDKIKELLESDTDLSFLMVLKKEALETLVASIRKVTLPTGDGGIVLHNEYRRLERMWGTMKSL